MALSNLARFCPSSFSRASLAGGGSGDHKSSVPRAPLNQPPLYRFYLVNLQYSDHPMFPLFSLQDLLLRLVAVVLILSLKGFVQAWMAAKMGDEGPRQDGRETLNSAQHISFLGLVSFLFFSLGWTKPMNLSLQRLGSRGLWAVAVSGLLTCVALALIAVLLRPLAANAFSSGDMGFVLVVFLNMVIDLSLWCAVLNLIPLFPLDGFTVLAGYIPSWWQWVQARLLYFEVGLLVLGLFKVAATTLGPVQQWLKTLMGA
jgi:Zn-dependent protease